MATRKSTPKFVIVTYDTSCIVYGPASRTDCERIARGMNIKDRPISVKVIPAAKAA